MPKRSDTHGKWRVLVVEDHEPARQLWVDALGTEGYTVHEACDGLDALETLQSGSETPVDLVVTDLNMPRMDGLTLIGEVSARWPDIAVLVLTAAGDKDSIRRCLRAGVVEYLEKPVLPDELTGRVRLILAEGGARPGPLGQLRQLRREMDNLVRQAAEENQAELLEWLRGGVNHRFNQPLQVLYGNTRLLQRILEQADLSPDLRAMAGESCGELISATDCIRDLSQLMAEIREMVPTDYVGESKILDLERSAGGQ